MIDNNNDTTIVEEVIETSTPEIISEQQEPKEVEKTFTSEQVASMMKSQRDKERAKAKEAVATNEELTKRLEAIEAERAKEKEELELRTAVAKELADSAKKEGLKTYIESKVLDTHVERFMSLTLLDSNEDEGLDALKAKADALIADFPGVERTPKVAAGSTLNKAEINPVEEKEEIEETGYYTLNGTKLDYTDAEYQKLSFVQKQSIKVVK